MSLGETRQFTRPASPTPTSDVSEFACMVG